MSNSADSVTRLTKAERDFIRKTVSKWPRKKVLSRLRRDLQKAVEIELATIPIYLYTYYSLLRTKDIAWNTVSRETRFANEAGAVIMSVAVEEMLHMSLSSNVFYSLFGEPPELYLRSPKKFPTDLGYLGHSHFGPKGPHGKKKIRIPLAKLNFDQLWHFLQIEYPEPPGTKPRDQKWDTIGQFYSYIRCLICAPQITDADFQNGKVEHQIQPTNYSPNNIDTVNPRRNFDPWKTPEEKGSGAKVAEFQNEPDSHTGPSQLLTVDCRLGALEAIDTICDQGEGFGQKIHGHVETQPTDDPKHHEDSHYFKFLMLQSQFKQYADTQEELPKHPKPPEAAKKPFTEEELKDVIVNFRDSPTTESYRDSDLRDISNFINGVYEYMLIMTETLFLVTPAYDQKLFFNQGMHRSMIWILDKLSQVVRKIPLGDGTYFAPTFQNGALDVPRSEAFTRLCDLGELAIKAAAKLQAEHDNKDGFEGLEGNIRYYVNTALHDMSNGRSMHMPDVSRYWKCHQE